MQNSHGSRRTSTDYGGEKDPNQMAMGLQKARLNWFRLHGLCSKKEGLGKLLATSQAPGRHVDIVCDLATY